MVTVAPLQASWLVLGRLVSATGPAKSAWLFAATLVGEVVSATVYQPARQPAVACVLSTVGTAARVNGTLKAFELVIVPLTSWARPPGVSAVPLKASCAMVRAW